MRSSPGRKRKVNHRRMAIELVKTGIVLDLRTRSSVPVESTICKKCLNAGHATANLRSASSETIPLLSNDTG